MTRFFDEQLLRSAIATDEEVAEFRRLGQRIVVNSSVVYRHPDGRLLLDLEGDRTTSQEGTEELWTVTR